MSTKRRQAQCLPSDRGFQAGCKSSLVYLKAAVGKDFIDFHIAECSPFDGGDETVACADAMRGVRRKSLGYLYQFAKAT